MPRQILTGVLALVACTLRPYTSDSAGSTTTTTAATTSTSTAATTTTGPTPHPTTGEPATSETTTADGGVIVGTWRGLYRGEVLGDRFPDNLYPEDVFHDCATEQTWQLVGDLLPYKCGEADYGDGLYVHLAGVLHPDGDDADDLAELEVTEVLGEPCVAGACDQPFEWSSCAPWHDVCGSYTGCDPWEQDCPEGQKCMAYSSCEGCSWDSTKCAPVVRGAAGLNEPCTAENDDERSGVDTCAFGYLCWDIHPDTGISRCLPQCTGDPNAAACPSCFGCAITGSSSYLLVCLQYCSALLQDCGDGWVCTPGAIPGDSFWCEWDVSGPGGQVFDDCEYDSACDPGLWCAPPDQAIECDPMAPGCCLPFCDTLNPSCPGAGQECLPWLDPPGEVQCNDNLGRCALPP